MAKISTVEEFQKRYEEFVKDLENDGHPGVSKEWFVEVMLDQDGFADSIKELLVSLLK